MNTAREKILARVNAALAPLPRRAALPDWENTANFADPAPDPEPDRWRRFARATRAASAVALDSAAELVALLVSRGCRRGYCDPALWPEMRPAFLSGDIAVETTFARRRVNDYDFGITGAAGAIAETGTLILTDAASPSRLGALAPWIHVAVVRRAQIHPDLLAATRALPDNPNVVWVTGPSKTADVDGILIEGVHGPGLQIALLLPDAPPIAAG